MREAGTTVIFPRIRDPSQSEFGDFEGGEEARDIQHEFAWEWRKYVPDTESTVEVEISEETSTWRTGGYDNGADDDYYELLVEGLTGISDNYIREMFYKQHFYSEHLKGTHSFTGTYFDVDGLLVRDKTVVPYEIKEKSAYEDEGVELFGLDVSRLIVMLRTSLAEGLDPVYVVREVVEEEDMHGFDRDFVDWHTISASDVIRASAWQVQGGGPGMGGARTQTLMIPKSEFDSLAPASLDPDEFTDFVGNFQPQV
ncbi:hypothetical protein [Halobacterium rubrum]|uniref:hypothetical protein n=1 Tax=Halobacterium TaxID=2239 RepID=UPI001F1AD610|nr:MULTISPECIES: hypothetical protein [Halobacterium]MDH5021824.1 hypothetical protein [Halobacterium rubrum]